MDITYYGQNSLSITMGGQTVVVDPFITENKLSKDKVDIDDIAADYIFLTHAHFDHSLDAETIARNTGAPIVGNFEIFQHYSNKELDAEVVNQGGTLHLEFGTAKAVSAIHTSSFPDGSYGGTPCGYIFTANGTSIYVAGDTALTMDMKLIPTWANIDLAVLPIGDVATMGVADAITAANFVECDRVMGAHYDVLPFIEIDRAEAKKAFKAAGKTLELVPIGESIRV